MTLQVNHNLPFNIHISINTVSVHILLLFGTCGTNNLSKYKCPCFMRKRHPCTLLKNEKFFAC